EAGHRLGPVEAEDWWWGHAWKEITDDKGRALIRYLRKLWLFGNAFEIPQVDNVYFLSRYLPGWIAFLAHSTRWLLPLACFGLFAAWRRGPKLVPWLAVAYALVIAGFFVTDRYRFWIVPVAALYAGAGVTELVALLRGRPSRSALAECGVLALAAFVLNL